MQSSTLVIQELRKQAILMFSTIIPVQWLRKQTYTVLIIGRFSKLRMEMKKFTEGLLLQDLRTMIK